MTGEQIRNMDEWLNELQDNLRKQVAESTYRDIIRGVLGKPTLKPGQCAWCGHIHKPSLKTKVKWAWYRILYRFRKRNEDDK